MILSFSFKYSKNNDVLEFLLDQILSDFSYEYSILTQENITTLYVKSSEEELERFAQTLALNLPMSIFLRKTSVLVEEKMPKSNLSQKTKLKFGLTPKMIEVAKDDSSPFVKFNLSKENLDLVYKNKTYKERYNGLFESLTKDLKAKKIIQIQAKNKSFILGDLSLAKDDFLVIPTDFSLLSKIAVLNDDEKKALNSLEKPIIFTKVNLIFKAKEILQDDYINIKMADNLFLYFLCKKLYEQEMEFIFITQNKSKFDESIEFKDFKFDDKSKVVALNDGKVLPLIEAKVKPNSNDFQEFQKSLSFYLDTKNDDKIVFKDKICTEKVKFPKLTNTKEIFTMIENLDDGGKRLLQNYKNEFTELFDRIFMQDISNLSSSFYSLLCVAGVILGFDKSFSKAGEKLLLNSEDFGGKKGPRIDCFLTKDGISFDVARFIRSGMSFKLAGVDDMVLSFGYIQSLALFLADFSDNHKEETGSDVVEISGLMFGYKKLLNEFYESSKANHKITLCPIQA